jgi:hypothetical protein
MNEDPASLDRLHDLVVPPPVPWWPPTPGWWIVIGIVVTTLVVITAKAFIRWQANRYRREALALLDDPSTPASEWPAILKRCALAAWPRTTVAPLTGTTWERFFRESAPRDTPAPGTGTEIEDLGFNGEGGKDELKEAASDWVRYHRKEAQP